MLHMIRNAVTPFVNQFANSFEHPFTQRPSQSAFRKTPFEKLLVRRASEFRSVSATAWTKARCERSWLSKMLYQCILLEESNCQYLQLF